MRVWYDAEFMEDGRTIEPLSFGFVREDGKEFYAEVFEANLLHANPWVKENVIPHLQGLVVVDGYQFLTSNHPVVMPRSAIAEAVKKFVGPEPEFWGWYCAYDWVLLCQLYGAMMDLPEGWPMLCLDIKQVQERLGVADDRLPKQTMTAHISINDARWTRGAWDWLGLYEDEHANNWS